MSAHLMSRADRIAVVRYAMIAHIADPLATVLAAIATEPGADELRDRIREILTRPGISERYHRAAELLDERAC